MNDEKEKWMEEVLQSMKGIQRAKPMPELLTKIENQIASSKMEVVHLRQLRYVAAIIVLLLFVDTIALVYDNQNQQPNNEDVAVMDTYNQSLISSYQIYE
ncbi:MAG: hypothetical protein Sapg2KO_44290 [Saprospiraceae bacterium]